jgi:hypothetical protein
LGYLITSSANPNDDEENNIAPTIPLTQQKAEKLKLEA